MLSTLGKRIVDFLFPHQCSGCRVDVGAENTLCIECWKQVRFITYPLCKRCGYPLDEVPFSFLQCPWCPEEPYIHHIRSAVIYNDMIRKLILRFKQCDEDLLSELFATWLYQAVPSEDIFWEGIDVITVVPLHKKRLWSRQFNQSVEIVWSLQNFFPFMASLFIPDLLYRSKMTSPQGVKGQKQRAENVRGAFEVRRNVLGKHILIVDDVLASGATLKECAKVLHKAGAKSISGLTVARSVESRHPRS